MLDLFRHVPPAVMEFINDHNPKLKVLHRVAGVANEVASGLIAQKTEDIKGGNPNKDIMTFLGVPLPALNHHTIYTDIERSSV